MTAAISAATVVCGLSGCAIQVGERDLLRPVAASALAPQAVAAVAPAYRVEEGFVTAADGTRLYSVLLRQPGSKATILYFGGNQFTVGRLGAVAAAIFAPMGVNLMLVDHRGYGQSGGTPAAATLMSDGLAVFDHLAEQPGIDRNRIVVHGQSLGSFVAGHVAANRKAAGVVLESSVTTTEEWVKARAGSAPVKVKVSPALAGQGNRGNVPRIEEPLLILVGREDKVTPPDLSEALYRLSPLPSGRKQLVVVPGAGHNDVLRKAEAMRAYRDFILAISR